MPGVGVVVGCREERPSWRSNVDLMSKRSGFSLKYEGARKFRKEVKTVEKFMKSYLRFLWGQGFSFKEKIWPLIKKKKANNSNKIILLHIKLHLK